MPKPKPKTAPDAYGNAVMEDAWEHIGPAFQAWAREREEVLRGYRLNEINVQIRAGNRFMARHLEAARTERFDPGRFSVSSGVAARESSMPGSVRVLSDRQPPVGLSFRVGLPTDFVSRHPEAEQAVRKAMERACETTGLSLRVLGDRHGGSNWVLDGYLDRPEPGDEPAVAWKEPLTQDEHAAAFGP